MGGTKSRNMKRSTRAVEMRRKEAKQQQNTVLKHVKAEGRLRDEARTRQVARTMVARGGWVRPVGPEW